MRPHTTSELTIRVPGPFEGVDELGFSARYPEQHLLEPLRDVPLWIEGPPPPLRRLLGRLRMLHDLTGGAYAWTDPVQLADEVLVVAFRDLTTSARFDPSGFSDYVANLVRPVVFPFLADCARVADLRLAQSIEVAVEAAGWPIARFRFEIGQIVAENGFDLLGDAA